MGGGRPAHVPPACARWHSAARGPRPPPPPARQSPPSPAASIMVETKTLSSDGGPKAGFGAPALAAAGAGAALLAGPQAAPPRPRRRPLACMQVGAAVVAATDRPSHTFGAGFVAPHPSIRKDAVDVDGFLREHEVGLAA